MTTEYEVKQISGIEYDPDRGLCLDLHLPLGVHRPPVAVYLHGGAWLMGHRAEAPERLQAMASQGLAVASIDYRTVNLAAYPAQHEDILHALDWVGSHGDEYGLGRGAPFLMGSSAGAHLAALSAFRLVNPVRVEGFIGLFGRYNLMPNAPAAAPGLVVPEVIRASTPPFGFEGLDHNGRLALLAGTTPEDLDETHLESLSPLLQVSKQAPAVFLAHGTRDAIVNHRHSLDLAARLAEAGSSREVDVVLLPGANHEDDTFADPAFARTVAQFAQRNQA
jgi:acetyl esterase/lipase